MSYPPSSDCPSKRGHIGVSELLDRLPVFDPDAPIIICIHAKGKEAYTDIANLEWDVNRGWTLHTEEI